MINKLIFVQSSRGFCFKLVCKVNRKIGKEKDKLIDRQIDWLIDRQISRQFDRQIGGNLVIDIERDSQVG